MFSYNSLPPDPELVGTCWRRMWFERLEGSGLWLEKWLEHQRRDSYWKHGSICEDYGAIACPVLAVSGWSDGYSNAIFRLLARLRVPRKGLVGPWGHRYPHFGEPGPAIGFLQELLRWWDHWLKGIDTGVMDEPMLRVWMQESVPPTTSYKHRPGRWIGESSWPSQHIGQVDFALAQQRLTLEPNAEVQTEGPDAKVSIQSPLTVGLFAGKWCSYASGPDLAHDQREEDGGALVFESGPLNEAIELLGAPLLEIGVVADRPIAMLAARLSDVRPNDEATRVTYGLLNLTHRSGSETPEPLEPGKLYRITLKFNEIAQMFPAGHRIRLSLSTSYWPLAWPPPEPVRLTFHLAKSKLTLPVRRPRPTDDCALPRFHDPEGASPPNKTTLEPEQHRWVVYRDLASDESVLHVIDDRGTTHFKESDLTVQTRADEWYRSCGDDFASIRGETHWTRSLSRGDWHIRTEARTRLMADKASFHIRADLDAYEIDGAGERRVFSRSWERNIPRDLV